jgi:hypothetical protein
MGARTRIVWWTFIVELDAVFGVEASDVKKKGWRQVDLCTRERDLTDAGEVRLAHARVVVGCWVGPIHSLNRFVDRHWEEFQFWVINVGLP